MKKSLLIITFFLISILNVCAQIAITSADMAVPTKVVYHSNDSLSAVSIGSAGISQTWDFTAVVEDSKDTSYALPYSSMPNTAFSTANLIVQQGNQDIYGYLINSTPSFIFIGGSATVNVYGYSVSGNRINSPAETMFNFPASYDSSFTNNYTTDAKSFFGQTIGNYTIDSVRQRSTIQKSFLVDAYGTLTTPLAGGPYDVIRTKVTKITHDTISILTGYLGWVDFITTADSTTTFSWWANGIGTALATATMDSTGAVANLQWLSAQPVLPTLSASVSSTNITCTGTCDGTATAIAHWGIPPFTYSWNTTPVQDSVTATGLCLGTYTLTITDSANASATSTVTFTTPPHPIITSNGTVLSAGNSGNGFQWYLNDSIITGATSSNYTATQNGNYTVSFNNGNGCTDTTSAYTVTNIGISESLLNNSISVYPSPATNKISIRFDASSPFMTTSAQEILIEINNELGQNIKLSGLNQLAVSKNEMTLDITDLPDGIYFIRIKDHTKTVNKKFIKQ